MAEERKSEQWVGDSEFMGITGNDPVAARNMRRTLEQLVDKGSGTVSEMAREVLSGRIGLREAVTIPAYSEALVSSMQPFKEKWEELSDAEREELAAEGKRQYEEQEAELRAERAASQGGSTGNKSPRHSGGWSL